MKIVYSFFSLNIALLVLISAFSQTVVAERLYKWVDKEGNVTYQSSPPPDDAAGVEKSKIRIDNTNEPEDEEGTESPLVEFYSKAECTLCGDARDFLEENEIPFEEFEVTAGTTEADEMQTKLGHNDVPTIIVGDRIISGYNENVVKNILKNAGFDIPSEE